MPRRSLGYESLDEPRDDEERELMDPETWDWERAEPGVPSPHAGAILPIRFTREEVTRLQAAALQERLSMHALVKRAALAEVNSLLHAGSAGSARRN